jgi:hypothetical protein
VKRRIARSLLLGTIAAVVGLAVKLEYCIGGPGYGLPAAVIHPSHQEWWLVSLASPPSIEGLAFDPLSLCINVAVLSSIIFAIATAVDRRRPNQSVVPRI